MKKFFAYLIAAVMFFTVSGAEKMNIRYPSVAKVMSKARKGGEITVVFLGGSLTWGANASAPNITSWRGRTMAELKKRYPAAHWEFADAAIGATGSSLGIFRLERDVFSHDPDLVILDFTLNDRLSGGVDGFADQKNQSYEALIRTCLKRNVAVFPVFTAGREHVEHPDINKWQRRLEHIRLFEAYQLEYADILGVMHREYHTGRIDTDGLWAAEYFDSTHPHDRGYAVYTRCFFAEWERIEKSPVKPVILPEKPLTGDSYNFFSRVELSKLSPEGWDIRMPVIVADSYDFMASRWIDKVIEQGNAVQCGSVKWQKRAGKELFPFTFSFRGEQVILLAETLPESVAFTVSVNGGEPRKIALRQVRCSQLHYAVLAENLAADQDHFIRVVPQLPPGDQPGIMRWSALLINGSQCAEITGWQNEK